MTRKTDIVKALVNDGEYRRAMNIVRNFRLNFTVEEMRIIQIASDTMNGNGLLYRQLGIDTDAAVSRGIEILQMKF